MAQNLQEDSIVDDSGSSYDADTDGETASSEHESPTPPTNTSPLALLYTRSYSDGYLAINPCLSWSSTTHPWTDVRDTPAPQTTTVGAEASEIVGPPTYKDEEGCAEGTSYPGVESQPAHGQDNTNNANQGASSNTNYSPDKRPSTSELEPTSPPLYSQRYDFKDSGNVPMEPTSQELSLSSIEAQSKPEFGADSYQEFLKEMIKIGISIKIPNATNSQVLSEDSDEQQDHGWLRNFDRIARTDEDGRDIVYIGYTPQVVKVRLVWY